MTSILVAVFGYFGYQSVEDSSQLQPLLGIFSFIIIGLLFSGKNYFVKVKNFFIRRDFNLFFKENVRKVKLQPVICGALLQFLLAIFCIRWTVGRKIFECIGSKIVVFLNYTLDGASFVYGNFLVLDKKVFVFSVLPTIFFFNLCISVLHYLGVMQKVLMKLGSVLQSVLGTTICESVAAVGMIFLSITEGPLVIKPYIKSLTDSEMHAIMVSAYSTVSGTVLAAYISFGAEARHLITASVIAAPASLFFSKLMFPETEESKTSSKNIQLEKS